MRPPGDAGRKRLRRAAAALVLCLAAGAGYDIKNNPPTYLESAAVIFSLPKSQAAPNAYLVFASSLISSGAAMTQVLQSPLAQRQILQAGGTASVSLALLNLYNEDYPNYGEPLATLTVSSPSPASAHRTFSVARRLLGHLLAARQAAAGVLPRNRISVQIVGDTGPIVQPGSPKRVLAGLAVLALVAICALWRLVDRWAGAW